MAEIIIAVDAGHGLPDRDRSIPEYLDPRRTTEWWLNDRVADFMQERVSSLYPDMKLVRVDDVDGDVDVLLDERVRKANEAGAHFYLSIHHNAGAKGTTAGGITIYSYKEGTVGATIRDKIYNALIAAGGLRGNRATPKNTANYKVLRDTEMPAVLVELGFMDSRSDAPVILTEEYAVAMGYALADAIAEHFGVKKVDPSPKGTLYRLQLGAYSKKENADKVRDELIAAAKLILSALEESYIKEG